MARAKAKSKAVNIEDRLDKLTGIVEAILERDGLEVDDDQPTAKASRTKLPEATERETLRSGMSSKGPTRNADWYDDLADGSLAQFGFETLTECIANGTKAGKARLRVLTGEDDDAIERLASETPSVAGAAHKGGYTDGSLAMVHGSGNRNYAEYLLAHVCEEKAKPKARRSR